MATNWPGRSARRRWTNRAALVGPLALAQRWLALSSREPVAQRMLNNLHLQTNIAGWIVLIAGAAMPSVIQPLRAWLVAKLVIYCGIAVIMVLKPS